MNTQLQTPILLNSACMALIRRLLAQLLEREQIENRKAWSDLLIPILLEISRKVDPDVRYGDDIDVRRYVKFKKLSGGNLSESTYVDGIVFTNKLALKRMPNYFRSPRIMTITFPIQLHAESTSLLSLDPVISQGKDHLAGMVSQILKHNPDVLISAEPLSGLALEKFAEANVATIHNVKTSVIEAVSRFCKATIVISAEDLDNETPISLGTCEVFQVQNVLCGSSIQTKKSKSLVYLRGCPEELGCTIILRGATTRTLSVIKRIVEFMVFVVYNLRLETSFLLDEFALIPEVSASPATRKDNFMMELDLNGTQHPIGQDKDHATALESIQHGDIAIGDHQESMRKYGDTILSASPSAHFPPPFLLKRSYEEQSKLRALIKIQREHSQSSQEKGEQGARNTDQGEGAINFDPEIDPESLLLLDEIDRVSSSARAYGRLWETFKTQNIDMYNPLAHQNIIVLYSNVSNETSIPCHGPEIGLYEFYGETDYTLGQYLEDEVASARKNCDVCDKPLLHHRKHYVHGSGRLTISVREEPSPLPDMSNTALLWSKCKICGVTTPISSVSDLTWKYSFGKYLELTFYSVALQCRATMCKHDIHREHDRFFALHDMVIEMHYEPVRVLSVVVPQLKLDWNTTLALELKRKDYEILNSKITHFFRSLDARLNCFKFETLAPEVQEVKENERIVMLKSSHEDQSQLLESLRSVMNSSEPRARLPLNAVLRSLQVKVVGWDQRLTDYEKSLSLSETDIRQYTASQFKKLFGDRESNFNSDKQQPADEGGMEMLEKAQSSTKKTKSTETSLSSSEELKPKAKELEESAKELEETAKELAKEIEISAKIGAGAPSTNGDSLALAITEAPSERPKALAVLAGRQDKKISESRVQSLAHEFEKLTQRYAHEQYRQQENRRKREQSKKAHAVKSTEPIVEVFQDFEQAAMDRFDYDNEEQKQDIFEPTNVTAGAGKPQEQESTAQAPKDASKEPQPSADSEGQSEQLANIFKETLNGTELLEQNAEKHSIVKAISKMWIDSNIDSWVPLEYPLPVSAHVFADSDVIVREDEPSSLIAFTLSSSDYREKLNAAKSIPHQAAQASESSVDPPPNVSGSGELVGDASAVSTVDSEVSSHTVTGSPNSGMEEALLRRSGTHIKYQFQEGSATLYCKIYYAEQFDTLRHFCGCDDRYIESLARCVKWDSSGGKSGSAMLKTLDDRLVVKQMSKYEMDAFLKFASSYFQYMAQAFFHNLPTVLAKIFGFYQIGYRNEATGKKMKMDVVVIENLLYNRKMTRIFDLKGSLRNRHVQATGRENEVLLDENLVEYIFESPLFVREYSKRMLRASLWNDTLFLAKMNVMDYSLVIGIDEEKHELVLGIIDFIRTFTWDKKLESWVKERGLVGGGIKEPTVVTPRQYKNRFRESMERYFLMVPSCWHQFNLHWLEKDKANRRSLTEQMSE